MIGMIIAVLTVLIVNYLPHGVDWRNAFRPATQATLDLKSPYSIDGYYNPPWAIIPLIPLALLPESVGYAFLILLSLAIFSYTAHRLGAKPIVVIAILLSPPVLHSLLNGNIDAFAVLGFVLPPQIGLFFVLIKPQIGIALALYWLIEAWRQGGMRQVIQIFSPITVVMLGSFLLFGLWPLRFIQEIDLWWNASLWPISIPVGLVLVAAAIRYRQMGFAMVASPCLSPYVLFHAWVGVLFALVSRIPMIIMIVLGLWILVGLQAF